MGAGFNVGLFNHGYKKIKKKSNPPSFILFNLGLPPPHHFQRTGTAGYQENGSTHTLPSCMVHVLSGLDWTYMYVCMSMVLSRYMFWADLIEHICMYVCISMVLSRYMFWADLIEHICMYVCISMVLSRYMFRADLIEHICMYVCMSMVLSRYMFWANLIEHICMYVCMYVYVSMVLSSV